MRAAVCLVVELVGPDRAVGLAGGQFLGEAAGIAHVVVGVRVGDGVHLDQLGAEQADGVLLFLALGARHNDDDAVAQRLADEGEADTGIAGGAFDDGAARLQQAGSFGFADDAQRGAILDRLAGVQELALAEDLAAGLVGCAFQAQQRRVADQVNDRSVDGHGRAFPRRFRAFPSLKGLRDLPQRVAGDLIQWALRRVVK